jgi:hypothetical protein
MQRQNSLFKRRSLVFLTLPHETIFRIGILFVAIWFVYFAISTILIPYPIEYREGATQVLTQFLLNGENPFSISNQPLGMNNYGILYNLAAYPFVIFFGNTLALYRSINFIFLLVIFLIISRTAYKSGSDRYIALACGLMIVIAVSSHGGFGAFPSIMGTFLFLSASLIPLRFSFSHKSLWTSAFLAVLAYYTKPYFVLSFGIVAGYIFLFVSKKKGILYGLIFSVIFTAFYLPVRLNLDFYFINTFWGNIANTNKSFTHMYMQLFELAKEFFPIVLLAGWIIFRDARMTQKKVFPKIASLQVDVQNLNRPVFSQSMNYFSFWGLCSVIAFIFILGGHRGSYMIYAYQLMLSPLLLRLAQKINLKIYTDKIVLPLILLNMTILSFMFLNINFLSQKNSPEWGELYEYVANSTNILNSPVIVSAMLERGMMPVDSGQTHYYYHIEQPYPQSKLLGPGYSIFKKRGKEYKESISRLVRETHYDRLLLDEGQWLAGTVISDMVKNYILVNKITVPMPMVDQNWTIEVWEPIKQE